MEVWLRIFRFPGYSVSDEGRIRNDETNRILALLLNQHGSVYVGLTRERVQYKRSVTLLVANAFVPKQAQYRDTFDTPINLDGDRTNNKVPNLMWRPRWFAIKYFQQFKNNVRGFSVPIEEVLTGERFNNSWEASIKYGLIDLDIMLATINQTYVWPSYQTFRVL